MNLSKWRTRFAALTMGLAFQFLTIGPGTGGCIDTLLRIPTIDPMITVDSCHDGIDNDGDGLTDWRDPDCRTTSL